MVDAPVARDRVDERRAAAAGLVDDGYETRDRALHAPPDYVLSHSPVDVARHAALLEPVPAKRKVRVQVSSAGEDWRIEVACRDRHGLLATVAGVLLAHDLDVLDAVAVTWPDGGAIESFTVRGPDEPPDERILASTIAGAFRAPFEAPPLLHTDVAFDDRTSRWYTVCVVAGRRRPGLRRSRSR